MGTYGDSFAGFDSRIPARIFFDRIDVSGAL